MKHIQNIKIFGERNSGTTFLRQLIEKNVSNVNILSPYYNKGSGWKHGYPRIELFKNLDTTLFIFIIRDLDSWIKSMYYNHYNYKKPDNISSFLKNPLEIWDFRKDHDVYIYKEEQQNVVDLRYFKINSYFEFCKKVPNFLFIHLEDLQLNNKKFLSFLNTNYSITIKKLYVPIEKHTKEPNINSLNRIYNLLVPEIENKDSKIEEFIEKLKTKYYYKSIFIK